MNPSFAIRLIENRKNCFVKISIITEVSHDLQPNIAEMAFLLQDAVLKY